MNSAVTLVDFDRLLNGLDHIYSEFSRACGLSDAAEADAALDAIEESGRKLLA